MEEKQLIHTEVVDIDDLIQDDHNFNKGTEEGARLIERSFKDYGAGRSVFIDRNNRLVGGNKAQKGFKGAGFRKVVIVDSDADTLVAVRRKDVDLDSKEGRDMALLDNLTTQVNLTWDVRAPFTQGGGLRRGCGVDIKDKHGNRIQVGDAVRTKYGRICRVQFRQTPCFIGYDLTPIEAEHDAPDEFDLWNPCNLEIVNDKTLPETMPESFITI